jgi:hypothetical protein
MVAIPTWYVDRLDAGGIHAFGIEDQCRFVILRARLGRRQLMQTPRSIGDAGLHQFKKCSQVGVQRHRVFPVLIIKQAVNQK